MSVNLSLLEAKVDSAVASQSAPAIAGASEAAAGPSSQAQAAPHTVEAPPSTTPSTSDGMEEIDVVAADVLHGGKVPGEPLAFAFTCGHLQKDTWKCGVQIKILLELQMILKADHWKRINA